MQHDKPDRRDEQEQDDALGDAVDEIARHPSSLPVLAAPTSDAGVRSLATTGTIPAAAREDYTVMGQLPRHVAQYQVLAFQQFSWTSTLGA
jgi:hypothetical protein